MLHVRGVRAGAESEADVTRLFEHFGAVVQVTVRERTDPATGADTSWALVTMASRRGADAAVMRGVHERLDPQRAVTCTRFSKKQAEAIPSPIREPSPIAMSVV